jgi:hypothetical protein
MQKIGQVDAELLTVVFGSYCRELLLGLCGLHDFWEVLYAYLEAVTRVWKKYDTKRMQEKGW